MPSFAVGRDDAVVIAKIVARAARLLGGGGVPVDRISLDMDVTAVHANGCALDLEGLLAAGDGDFAHDVSGIVRHIDRTSGDLQDCFLPRFTQR